MKEYLENIALGALQGLTEFLPVSSSGHLVALENLLETGGQNDLVLEVFLHLATLLAVLIVFRKDLETMLRGLVAGGEGRLLLFRVAVGCLPAAVAGLLLKDFIQDLPRRWPLAVPCCWVGMSGVLLSLRKFNRVSGPRGESERASEVDPAAGIGWGSAIWIGTWQILALLPGISRSGITIAAALWIRRRPSDAASFSFLLSIPLILGATLLIAVDLGDSVVPPLLPAAVGGLVAFVCGWFALVVLLGMLRRGSLYLWSFYLVAVAIAYGGWVVTRST